MGPTAKFKISNFSILQWSSSTLLCLTLIHSFPLSPQEPFISQSWTSRMPSSLSPLTHSHKHLYFHLNLPLQPTFYPTHLDCPTRGILDRPHPFGQALASDLLFVSPQSKLIQYVDDFSPAVCFYKLVKWTPLLF